MMLRILLLSVSLQAVNLTSPAESGKAIYVWCDNCDSANSIANRIETPRGYERVQVGEGSFEEWLRDLPLKDGCPPVHLYDGSLKGNQSAHCAVVDIDVGKRDLQQCADAIIRLRAEYLFSKGMYESIHFNLTSGDIADFLRWSKGYRPLVRGRVVNWQSLEKSDSSYSSFREYLTMVFTYAGTASYSRELNEVGDVGEIKIGDVFIEGGFPGHAVLVVDVAVDRGTGKRVFLLAQSYMPAQEIHILKNPADTVLSPWYGTDFGKDLVTPEWIFERKHLKRSIEKIDIR